MIQQVKWSGQYSRSGVRSEGYRILSKTRKEFGFQILSLIGSSCDSGWVDLMKMDRRSSPVDMSETKLVQYVSGMANNSCEKGLIEKRR